jgi:hypothetical protein
MAVHWGKIAKSISDKNQERNLEFFFVKLQLKGEVEMIYIIN